MPAIVPWTPTETARQVIEHLRAGRAVVLPSESTYELVASAFHAATIEPIGETPALEIPTYARLFDWMPWLTGGAERLMRKLAPGPFILRAHGGYSHGLLPRLPVAAQRLVVREHRLAVRWPDHLIWTEFDGADLPLITSAIPGAVSAASAAALVGDNVACIVDGGATRHAMAPTLIESDGRRCRVVRAGALTDEQIDTVNCCRILFVCTGNTCRSPLAQVLCVKMLAEQLGCSVEELPKRGFCVQSAGLAAMMGGEASSESVQVAQEFGADLSAHHSAAITLEQLRWADHVFAMTAGHWYTLRSVGLPGIAPPRMLSPRFEDIDDPIGGTLADYRTCAGQILDCLRQRLPELLES